MAANKCYAWLKKNNPENIQVLEYDAKYQEMDIEGYNPNPHYWIQKL